MTQLRFSDLSAPRQAFIRQCQWMGFGKILGLAVCDCEPVFGPRTEVLLDVKLDGAGQFAAQNRTWAISCSAPRWYGYLTIWMPSVAAALSTSKFARVFPSE